jgi:hypothetical protein
VLKAISRKAQGLENINGKKVMRKCEEKKKVRKNIVLWSTVPVFIRFG